MILVGLGLYLGYVPYGCVLFDRTIAALGIVATAVFLIYVSDARRVSGARWRSCSTRRSARPRCPKLQFFRYFSYATSIVSTLFFTVSGVYFLRRARHA